MDTIEPVSSIAQPADLPAVPMPTLPRLRAVEALESPVEVVVVPADSPLREHVAHACASISANLVRADFATPSALMGRLMVVDLTRDDRAPVLGSRTIAISERLDIDCYAVITPDQVEGQLQRVLGNLVERERLLGQIAHDRDTIQILNEIGYALSAQTSQSTLLDQVLTHARRVLRADGGSIYLIEDDKLVFTCAQNDTIRFRPQRQELPFDETSLAGFVATRGQLLNIKDAYDLPDDLPYRINFSFDNETGYRTRSVLLVPMHDRNSDVIGVLALINRKRTTGSQLVDFSEVLPFTAPCAELARSIASQSAVAIENYRLYKEIRDLFDGFVEASVSVIEARDPSTGGHSYRVAALTQRLAQAATECGSGPFTGVYFSEQQLTELRYAAMLHDFGKVGVREEILLKSEKLFSWEMQNIEARFRIAQMQLHLAVSRGEMTESRFTEQMRQLRADLDTVRRLKKPSTRTTEADALQLERIAQVWKLVDPSERMLSPREVSRLCIPIGSLDPAERLEIESHVTHTYNFLRVIPWTPALKGVPDLAYAHHEKLDGTGYPRGLRDDEIPVGAQFMSITDIFDALTAGDRPYRTGMNPVQALGILRSEAKRGKLFSEAVELFAGQKLWTGLLGPGSRA